jgi:alpha-tubulin suppressor-like RCC1 family protein
LLISAKSCTGRNNKKTKTGSSDYNTFMINAPSGLSATAISFSQIDLSWQDNSNNEDGFEIWRSTDGINYELIITTTSNTYSDTGLLPLTAYYYRVRAFNSIGDNSSYSNEASSFTYDFSWWPTPWSAVAAGGSHTITLGNDRTLWGWGLNGSGQLGLGDIIDRTLPSPIETDTNWQTIVCGGAHSLGLKTDGTLWSWGASESGQLGTGDTTYDSLEPSPVGTDANWVRVSAGYNHSMGLKTDGTLWAWGLNDYYGLLGLGDTLNRNTPSQVGTQSDWSAVAAGYVHTIAIKTNRTIWIWGYNMFGELGFGSTGMTIDTPSQIGTNSDWSTVAAGGYEDADYTMRSYSISIKTNGALWAWGHNRYGQLGLGGITNRITPSPVGSDTDWSVISNGAYHTLGLKINGTAWSWGAAERYIYGQLGRDGSVTVPGQVGTSSDWLSLVGGWGHTVGLKTNGTIWVWGNNSSGQLGLGDTINRNIPFQLGTPLAPTFLSAETISSSQINLSWRDNSIELGFKIERKTTITGTWETITTVTSNVTSYPDTGLSIGVTYYYRVISYNTYGNSFYSNEANATPTIVAPSNLILTVVSSSQINLSWRDNSSEETSFKIERSYGGPGSYIQIDTIGPNNTLYSDTTVTPGNTYYYRIRVYNDLGNSLYSNEAGISLSVPPPPLLLNLTVVSFTQINLSWADYSNNETGFIIERSIITNTNYAPHATVGANVISYSDTTITPSNTYYYRIRAYNSLGDGSYSNELPRTTFRPLSELSENNLPFENAPGFYITGGYRFSSTANGRITALGRYIGDGVTGNTTVCLWNDTGTGGINGQGLLISTTVSSSAGWQWATLPTPINISADTFYRVSVSCTTFYWYTWFPIPDTLGSITISESCYTWGLDVFPGSDYIGTSEMDGWADIEFVAE